MDAVCTDLCGNKWAVLVRVNGKSEQRWGLKNKTRLQLRNSKYRDVGMWERGEGGGRRRTRLRQQDRQREIKWRRDRWGKISVLKQNQLLLLTTNPVKTVIIWTFCWQAALLFSFWVFQRAQTHTHSHTSVPLRACVAFHIWKIGCVFSMKTLLHSRTRWVQLRRKKHWKHTLTFHQTHALMQSRLDSNGSVCFDVCMTTLGLDLWPWRVKHCVYTCRHAHTLFF